MTARPAVGRRPASQGDLLVRALSRHRSRPLVQWDDEVLTAGGFADEMSRYAQVWNAWGIGEGSPAAILSGNRPEVLLAMSTAALLGVRWTPLHPLGSLDDHRFVLQDAGIETLFFDPHGFADRAAELLASVPTLRRLVALTPNGDVEDLTTAAARYGARALTATAVTMEDPASIIYSGGTTGRPKGAVESHRGLATLIQIQMAEWDWPDEVRALCATPLSHAGQLLFYPALLRGGSLTVLPSFDPERLLYSIERYRITTTLLVPTMIYRLLDDPAFDKHDLGSLRTLVYGASAMSPGRLAEGLERLGQVFFQMYGQAECPATIAVLRRAEHRLDRPGRLASCGRAVPWLDVELRDGDGQPVGPGGQGEICVRGPLVMDGYLNQPEQTAEVFRDGWLHTGDVATIDEQGFMTIVDRTKDMIITGGFNVYPREIEDVLTAHPDVAAAAVIGVPDAKWGETVKAVVVRRPGAAVTEAELVALVRARKGVVAAPKSVDFVADIPLTAVAKPDKKALRARYGSAGGDATG